MIKKYPKDKKKKEIKYYLHIYIYKNIKAQSQCKYLIYVHNYIWKLKDRDEKIYKHSKKKNVKLYHKINSYEYFEINFLYVYIYIIYIYIYTHIYARHLMQNITSTRVQKKKKYSSSAE